VTSKADILSSQTLVE